MSGNKKRQIKSKKYKYYNISAIDDHRRSGKTLSTPFNSMKTQVPLVFNSWLDAAMADLLWAVMLSSHFERNDYLDLFRKVIHSAREEIENYGDTFITHTSLSKIPPSDFDVIFAPVFERSDIKEILSALLLLPRLPDLEHWSRSHTHKEDSIFWECVIHCF